MCEALVRGEYQRENISTCLDPSAALLAPNLVCKLLVMPATTPTCGCGTSSDLTLKLQQGCNFYCMKQPLHFCALPWQEDSAGRNDLLRAAVELDVAHTRIDRLTDQVAAMQSQLRHANAAHTSANQHAADVTSTARPATVAGASALDKVFSLACQYPGTEGYHFQLPCCYGTLLLSDMRAGDTCD